MMAATTEGYRLRPYQEAAAAAVLDGLAQGRRRVVLSLPTGAGKTATAATLARRLGWPVLWLAHRDELIRQAADAFRRAWPEARIGIVQADRDEPDADVVVASIQSLHPRRLQRWAPARFGLVVIDEAQHAPAPSYRAVLDRLTPRLLLGLTATPFRADRASLATVFPDGVAYAYGLREAIRDGWLVDIRAYRVAGPADLDAVPTRAGDLAAGDLERAVNTTDRNALLVAAYRQHADGRRALAFAAGVAHAHALAAAFRSAGIPAEAVDGSMPLEDRRAVLARLRGGETRVVANAMLLTEGFDEPSVAAVLLARPTKSLALYTQMAGRGTRPAPGKADLVLIDVADNTRRHRLVTVRALLGLRRDPPAGASLGTVLDREDRITAAGEAWLAAALPHRVAAEAVVDLYADLAVTDRPEGADWRTVLAALDEVRQDPARYAEALEAARRRMGDPAGRATTRQQQRLRDFGWPEAETSGIAKWAAAWALDRHQQVLADWARQRRQAWARLWGLPAGALDVDRALWQLTPATDPQRRFLTRLGLPEDLRAGLTRGEASWLIDALRKGGTGHGSGA